MISKSGYSYNGSDNIIDDTVDLRVSSNSGHFYKLVHSLD